MKSLIGVVLAVLAMAASTMAQTPSSVLVGRVQDSSGAMVPGATITVKETDTNEERKVTTNDTGDYTVPQLAPGNYSITVDKEGFKQAVEKDIVLLIDQTARYEFTLQVGSIATEVVVAATTPLINTESSTKGDVMTSSEIIGLPLNGRDFTDLAFSVSGVAQNSQGGLGSSFAVAGTRAETTNFVVDGITTTNPTGGGTMSRPPIEAMQEFKMQTQGYPAEFGGRMTGGNMQTVLKSGGNQLHGSLFEFLRNDKLDARNFFAQSLPTLKQNQFGGMVSGPVFIPKVYDGRNKTFFLFSWESFRSVSGETGTGNVPTLAELTGDFSGYNGTVKDPNTGKAFPGNIIPVSRLDPVALQVEKYYPAPNCTTCSGGNYYQNGSSPTNWDNFLVKLDHRFTQNDALSFKYMPRLQYTPSPYPNGPIGGFGIVTRDTSTLAGLNYVKIIKPKLINEARFALSRIWENVAATDAGQNLAQQVGITGVTTIPALVGMPVIQILNLSTLGNTPQPPQLSAINSYQYGDTLTWVKSKHMVKFGADILRLQDFMKSFPNARGTYAFQGTLAGAPFADFLLGQPSSTSRLMGGNPTYFFATNYGFFAQDDYRILPNLTLNLGVRYDIYKAPADKYDREVAYLTPVNRLVVASQTGIPAGGVTTMPVTQASALSLPQSLIATGYTDFSPRVGFAWRPFGGVKTVVRGGFGVFFSAPPMNTFIQGFTNVYPFAQTQSFSHAMGITLASPFPTGAGSTAGTIAANGFTSLAPNSQYLQQWNLTMEREIPHGMAVEVAYVASKGTHLEQRYNINGNYLSGPGIVVTKPVNPTLGNINVLDFGANSTFQSGMATLRKRFTHGVFYTVSYTFGKSIDEASQSNGSSAGGYEGGVLDPLNLRLERGLSNFDVRHNFTSVLMYQVPFQKHWISKQWQLSFTGRVHSGQPFTPEINNITANPLTTINRPNRLANGSLPNPTIAEWFNVADFTYPATNTYGNSGRDILEGPRFINLNLSLIRNFRVRERGTLQFRAESFNFLNHPSFALPKANINATNANGQSIAGVISATTPPATPRQMQFALRYSF